MTKILITGGAGYIGSHAAWACIDAGFDIVVLDNLSTGVARNVPASATLIEMDIGDRAGVAQVLNSHKVDAIMHFAGSIVVPESVVNPGLYYENNTAKSLGLIQEAVKAGVKAFIFSSTAAVYAPGSAEPLVESAAKAPLSPYGQSKLMTELMLADMSAAHGLSVGVYAISMLQVPTHKAAPAKAHPTPPIGSRSRAKLRPASARAWKCLAPIMTRRTAPVSEIIFTSTTLQTPMCF